MAEGFFKRFFGSEAEPEAEELVSEFGVDAPDQTARTLALQRGGQSPKVEREIIFFLKKQTEMLDEQMGMVRLQKEHLHEQRVLSLRHLRVRRWRETLQLWTQIFVGLVASLVGLGLLTMLYDAFASRAVVVDAFKAPAVLAGRGVTGDVVAEGVLDTLQKLQDATRNPIAGLTARGAWAGDVKIELPETGISIGEINRLLHERFGHDLHIGGDLVQTDTGGLALTVRGDGVPAKAFEGAAGELDKLSTEAAEYIYGRSQPSEYATYLSESGRDKDALTFLPAAFSRASEDAERGKLANVWGNAYLDLFQPEAGAEKYRLGMSLMAPRSRGWWTDWNNLVGAVAVGQGEEASWREGQAFLRAATLAPDRQRPESRLIGNSAQTIWNLPLLLKSNLADLAIRGGASTVGDAPSIADEYALLHDASQAARYIASSDPGDLTTRGESFLLQGYAALDRGDPTAAVAPLEAFDNLWVNNLTERLVWSDQPCFLGLTYGLVGRVADAEAVFRQIKTPWSRCYGFHGDALARAGDVAGAQRVWAEGVRQLPDLPNVYLERGRWELGRGDLKAAAADLSTASAKAPAYADPLKAWGDLLARERRWRDALAKYDEALRYAPAWIDLHRARDTAAQKM